MVFCYLSVEASVDAFDFFVQHIMGIDLMQTAIIHIYLLMVKIFVIILIIEAIVSLLGDIYNELSLFLPSHKRNKLVIYLTYEN